MGLFIGWKSGALVKYQMSHVMKKKKQVLAYAKNKDADQPANPCSLIMVFVNRCLDRTIYIRNSKPLARILSGANQFEFYLAEKSEGRLSRYDERAGTGQYKRSNELHREITNEMVCAPSKDSDLPG